MQSILSILISLFMLAAAQTPGGAAAPKDSAPGSTVTGCLKETGTGGYVLTGGTLDGVMIRGNGELKSNAGKWVEIDGESFYAGAIEHFRARTVTAIAGACAPGNAKDSPSTASAELKNPDGKVVGHAELSQINQGVLIKIELEGMPAGRHALHLHEKGACEGENFKSAGGHFNPTNASHGYLGAKGQHAGDMPNFDIPQSGKTTVEVLNSMVTLLEGHGNSLLGKDGTALVVHAGADDYKSQPSGDAGDRIACGVVTSAKKK